MEKNEGRARARHWALGVATGALMLVGSAQAQAPVATTQTAPSRADERLNALEAEIEALT
jgi:hypothetical protein